MRDDAVVKALVNRKTQLHDELNRIDLALAAFGSGRKPGRGKRKVVAKRRVMDDATREKISKKMRRTWALKRKTTKSKA